jgi:hypothetical protein
MLPPPVCGLGLQCSGASSSLFWQELWRRGRSEGKTAEAALTGELSKGGYDCIMVGAGLRIVPPYFLLFEKLINVIHRHAPASTKICFNTSPSDTADAVLRRV